MILNNILNGAMLIVPTIILIVVLSFGLSRIERFFEERGMFRKTRVIIDIGLMIIIFLILCALVGEVYSDITQAKDLLRR